MGSFDKDLYAAAKKKLKVEPVEGTERKPKVTLASLLRTRKDPLKEALKRKAEAGRGGEEPRTAATTAPVPPGAIAPTVIGQPVPAQPDAPATPAPKPNYEIGRLPVDENVERLKERNAAARRSPERRLMYFAFAAMVLSLALALGVNWASTPGLVRGGVAEKVAATSYEPDLKLDKPAVALLPGRINAYETMARHEIPGKGRQAAEAIYLTLNMDLEAQVSVGVYVRVEAFPSEEKARSRQQEVMREYPLRSEKISFGAGTVGDSGFTSNEGAWGVTWLKGQYLVFLKSSFKDDPPAEKRDFLRNVGRPVLNEIDAFHRTGQQGLTF